MHKKNGVVSVIVACVAVALPMAIAHAAYPERAVRLVVPFPAGGSTDSIARAVAHAMSGSLKQQVVVENRAGGGAVVGNTVVANAAPDGYTLLVSGSTGAVMKDMHQKLSFDPIESFVPVAMVAEIPNVLAVRGDSPWHSLPELIEAAKKEPGKLSYASAGPGTPANLVCERFKSEASLDILHVPYKGNAPAVNDVLGGQVPMMCNNLAGTLPYSDGGRLKLLAVTGKNRSPFLPDVPTFSELGIDNLETSVWMSIVAPVGTPEPVIARLNEAVSQALSSAEVKAQFANFGAVALPVSVDDFRARQQREKALWGDIIKSLGLTTQ